MDEDGEENDETPQTCCYNLHRKKQWIWLYTVVPSGFTVLLHLTCLLVDSAVAAVLMFTEYQLLSGICCLTFIYIPVIFILILRPPQLTEPLSIAATSVWLVRLLACAAVFPLLVSVSLLKRFLWTITAVMAKKPYEEILHDYEKVLPKEVHSYLFLQAFLHCAPQAILQIHFLLLGLSPNRNTAYLQSGSILVGLVTVAWRTVSLHRYEAQVVGGRPPILLTPYPEHTDHLTSSPLLPLGQCLQSKVVGLEMDCPLGKVVAFCSWFLLISGRLLCLVIATEMHRTVTLITLFFHFLIILLYLLSSQTATLSEVPSRLVSAAFSLIALVEVSVRFHKIPLLYTLFFMCILVEDTYLMILFFIYKSYKCPERLYNCSYLSTYAYLIINSHVIGIVLFGIYLSRLRPRRKSLLTSPPQV